LYYLKGAFGMISGLINWITSKIKKGKKESNLNVFTTYVLVIVIMALIFYPLFPLLLNYPPGSINTKFDVELSKMSYFQQYFSIIISIVVICYIILKLIFWRIGNWKYITKHVKARDKEKIEVIRRRSMVIPHIVYILQLIIPIGLVGLLFYILDFRNVADVKFFVILTVGLTFTGVISYMFSKKYFRRVLKYTFIDVSNLIIKPRINLRTKIIIQILPLFLFSFLFILFVGYAALVKEKGNALFESYQRELQMKIVNKTDYIQSEGHLIELLNTVKTDNKKDITFYIAPDGRYYTSDNSELSNFFIKYTKELAFFYNGHTYDYYGSEIQGAVVKLAGEGGEWILGIRYYVASLEVIKFFVSSFIILTIFAFLVTSYFAKTISDDISHIAQGLRDIAHGEKIDLSNKIPVISNDEIGDLAVAFNEVQEKAKNYVQDIRRQQEVIVERERLASLGQMISGITHNLKTPIISLLNATNSLKDLVDEYRASIGDERVNEQDHLEIASEMDQWLDEMLPYCNYMHDVLSTIRGQIIQGKTSFESGFNIRELLKRVEILTHYELVKSGCEINYIINVDLDTQIPGEVSNLVQVLDNLITNSIQAYRGKKGVIEVVLLEEANNLKFMVKDNGPGISDEIQSKLFKEMITTKGKMGTGLGLYISYAIIKGKFGGELWFESGLGKGTTFYVTVPIAN